MVAKGFAKLRGKQEQHATTISTLRNELNVSREELDVSREELNACRDKSGQLQTQVVALQEQLRDQAETIGHHITVAESDLRVVCLIILTADSPIEEFAEGTLYGTFSFPLSSKTFFHRFSVIYVINWSVQYATTSTKTLSRASFLAAPFLIRD